MVKKICRDCLQEKFLKEFSKSRHKKDGPFYCNSYCKKCMTIRTREWVKKNRVRFNRYQLVYWKNLQKRTTIG